MLTVRLNLFRVYQRILLSFSNSRTAALWVSYHNMVTLVKDFIRAERLHDYNMHLSAIALMLPFDRLGETKSSGGLTRGRTRSRESVWVA